MSPRSRNARPRTTRAPIRSRATSARSACCARRKRRGASAYAPYSRFAVGAALLTRSGRIVHGCNVENSSFGLSMCAERTALWNAGDRGRARVHRRGRDGRTGDCGIPCGACRQVLHEFAPDLWVYWRDVRGRIIGRKLEELLAEPFRFADAVAHGADACAAGAKRRAVASRRSNGRRGALPRVSPRRRDGAAGS